MEKCTNCGKEFVTPQALNGHMISCRKKVEDQSEEEQAVTEDPSDLKELSIALKTMLSLVEKGLSKFCSAAGVSVEDMDLMSKTINKLHDKYNK